MKKSILSRKRCVLRKLLEKQFGKVTYLSWCLTFAEVTILKITQGWRHKKFRKNPMPPPSFLWNLTISSSFSGDNLMRWELISISYWTTWGKQLTSAFEFSCVFEMKKWHIYVSPLAEVEVKVWGVSQNQLELACFDWSTSFLSLAICKVWETDNSKRSRTSENALWALCSVSKHQTIPWMQKFFPSSLRCQIRTVTVGTFPREKGKGLNASKYLIADMGITLMYRGHLKSETLQFTGLLGCKEQLGVRVPFPSLPTPLFSSFNKVDCSSKA